MVGAEVLTPELNGQYLLQYPHSPCPDWWTPFTTFVEHQGATSLVGSNMQPSYTSLVYLQRKGNWHALPMAGPSSTMHGPGVVDGGIVLVFSKVRAVVLVVDVVLVDVVDVVLVDVVVDVVEVAAFLFVQTALQSNPALVFFLSLFHNIFVVDWSSKGLLTEGLLEPQYLLRIFFPELIPDILKTSPALHFLLPLVFRNTHQTFCSSHPEPSSSFQLHVSWFPYFDLLLKPSCDRSLTADNEDEMSKDPQGILVRLVRKLGRVKRSSSILASYGITGSA